MVLVVFGEKEAFLEKATVFAFLRLLSVPLCPSQRDDCSASTNSKLRRRGLVWKRRAYHIV